MHRILVGAAALALAVAGVACDGENPSSASGAVVLRGTVVGAAAVSDTASAAAERAAGAKKITVTVQEDPSLTTTVSGNGTFELSGLPDGGFTLVFSSDGVTLGTILISGFDAAEEIRITVQVSNTTVVLIEIQNGDGDDGDDEGEDDADNGERTCAISGGKVGSRIELEGHVDSGDASGFELRVNGNRVKNGATVKVTTSGASFKCNGKPSASECKEEVKDGAKVHVRGNLNACSMDEATVVADEVRVQK